MRSPDNSGPPADPKFAVRQAPGVKPVRRTFPGPRGATASLRVAIDRRANADLVAHAKDFLEAEVCGVLVGQVGEDDEGLFVHVEAIIRGNAATQGATHVTFTQATWDAIHQTLESDHPKRRIVGWYHTHPGFGVEFSEMDVFIQRNFFSGSAQLALVTDPIDGAVAIAVTAEDGIEYLPRYWVDGREQVARIPAGAAGGDERGGRAAGGDLAESLRSLEGRVSQLIQVQDDQRKLIFQVMFTVGMVFCLAILGTVAYFIRSQYTARLEPPHLNGYVPVPVKIGDHNVLIGVGVVDWDVPPELNSLMLEVARQKQAETAPADGAAAVPADARKTPAQPKKALSTDERK